MKLAVFDFDSTLMDGETIEFLAREADIEDKVREITTRAMHGEIDFFESLIERVSLLKGLSLDKVNNILIIKITKRMLLLIFLEHFAGTAASFASFRCFIPIDVTAARTKIESNISVFIQEIIYDILEKFSMFCLNFTQ